MTRMTGPDCAVTCNLINTHTQCEWHITTRMTAPDCTVMLSVLFVVYLSCGHKVDGTKPNAIFKYILALISLENAHLLYIRLFHFIFHRNEIG